MVTRDRYAKKLKRPLYLAAGTLFLLVGHVVAAIYGLYGAYAALNWAAYAYIGIYEQVREAL